MTDPVRKFNDGDSVAYKDNLDQPTGVIQGLVLDVRPSMEERFYYVKFPNSDLPVQIAESALHLVHRPV